MAPTDTRTQLERNLDDVWDGAHLAAGLGRDEVCTLLLETATAATAAARYGDTAEQVRWTPVLLAAAALAQRMLAEDAALATALGGRHHTAPTPGVLVALGTGAVDGRG